MAATALASTGSFPRGRNHAIYTGQVERFDTTARDLFTLKAGDIPTALMFYSPTASNAGTSARVSIGSTGNATFFSVGIEVKTGTQSVGQSVPSSATNLCAALPFDTTVQATYAENGAASSAGGPWTVIMEVLEV